MSTQIGVVTFGGLDFTKLTVQAIRDTVKRNSYELAVIVGKPGDEATRDWLETEGIQHAVHTRNKGFPASLNDLFDRAWNYHNFNNVIIVGNDCIPYPKAIDAMIDCATHSDFEWVSASQFDVKTLVSLYPEAQQYFSGPNFVFTDFNARPWGLHLKAVEDAAARVDNNDPPLPPLIKDVQNLCLFKRSVLETIGYFDPAFFPNGYFSDCDYARRAVNANLKACALNHSVYYHAWSRTIHQGEGRPNDVYFERNRAYYEKKWGGPFGAETLTPDVKISDRKNESAIIDYWSTL